MWLRAFRAVLLLLVSMLLPIAGQAAEASSDITRLFSVRKSAVVFDRINQVLYSYVSISNNSGVAIPGRIRLVIVNPSIPVALVPKAPDGKTAAGEPFYWIATGSGGPVATGSLPQPVRVNFQLVRTALAYSVRVEYVADGVLLSGAPQSLALDAVFDLHLGAGITPDQLTLDSRGRRPVARNMMSIAFTPDATVDQVNGLLLSVGGGIVSMLEKVAIVLVRLPDPGSVAGLDSVIAGLRASPFVRRVTKTSVPKPNELPDNIGLPGDRGVVDHHLAIRAHAAWNARAALASSFKPLVIVADWFGNGAPGDSYDVSLIGPWVDHRDFTDPDLAHGYKVLSVIAASFGGELDGRGRATGIFPGTTVLSVVNEHLGTTAGPEFKASSLSTDETEDLILSLVKESNRNTVLNTSMGDGSCKDFGGQPVLCTVEEIEDREIAALNWMEKVRGLNLLNQPNSGLENKVLHVTAAGNANASGDTDARQESRWTLARLPGLRDPATGVEVPTLTNTLVVENRLNTANDPVEPGCLSSDSKFPGDLSAIGTDVLVLNEQGFDAPNDVVIASGTSNAAPQVAGLAAYVWALDPQLRPQQLIELLQNTAVSAADKPPDKSDPRCNQQHDPAPVIDAYAAVLATDDSLVNAKVRKAILDLDGNEQFDEVDLTTYIANLGSGAVDYSRYDLNGDGITGGPTTARFDLDVNMLNAQARWETGVQQAIEGTPVTFDETTLTDLEVLCYYAYSPLYVGDPETRRSLLHDRCATRLEVSLPPAFCLGTQLDLAVQATAPSTVQSGTVVPRPGLRIELSTNASADPSSGITNEDGLFSSSLVAAGSFTVEVTGHDENGNLVGGHATAKSLLLPSELCQGGEPVSCLVPGATYGAQVTATATTQACGATVSTITENGTFGDDGLWHVTMSIASSSDSCGSGTQGPIELVGSFGSATQSNSLHCTDNGELHYLGGRDLVPFTDGGVPAVRTLDHSASGCHPDPRYQSGSSADWTCCPRSAPSGPRFAPSHVAVPCGGS